LGWFGIALVAVGAILLPLNTLREFNLARYRSPALLWALLTAAATAGYSVTDSAAATHLSPGVWSALRYGVYEMFLSWTFYRVFLALGRWPHSAGQTTSWPRILVVGALLFSAYGLVLWAYQLSPHTSYVVALRQFSIVIGVVAGNLIFHEAPSRLRISAALIITLGGVCIALAR
jgi:drug/metabolite transporter (DMT)-like permease